MDFFTNFSGIDVFYVAAYGLCFYTAHRFTSAMFKLSDSLNELSRKLDSINDDIEELAGTIQEITNTVSDGT